MEQEKNENKSQWKEKTLVGACGLVLGYAAGKRANKLISDNGINTRSGTFSAQQQIATKAKYSNFDDFVRVYNELTKAGTVFDLNKSNNFFGNQTPIALSLYNNKDPDYKIANFLIDKGAKLNADISIPTFPLIEIVKTADSKAIKFIIDKLSEKQNDGQFWNELNKTIYKDESALIAAVRTPNNLEGIKHIFNKINFKNKNYRNQNNIFNPERNTLFHEAIKSGDLNQIKYLAESALEVDFSDNALTFDGGRNMFGETYLHLACELGDLEIVKYVLAKYVEKEEIEIRTKLQSKINKNFISQISHIRASTADPPFFNNTNFTLLHSAAKGGSLDVIKYLTNRGGIIVERLSTKSSEKTIKLNSLKDNVKTKSSQRGKPIIVDRPYYYRELKTGLYARNFARGQIKSILESTY